MNVDGGASAPAKGPTQISVVGLVGRTTLKLWPLYLFLFFAKLYVNMADEEPFSWTGDVLLAFSSPAMLAGFFFVALFLVLRVGVALKRRQLGREKESSDSSPPASPN